MIKPAIEIRDHSERPFVYYCRWYYSGNTGLQGQSVIYSSPTEMNGNSTVLLDPNTFSKDGTVALNDFQFSWDGSLVAYSIAR